MALDYFPCYNSYLKKCEKLTDQELGRLFRALMTYSATGERQELAGRESIAFDFIVDDMNRAKENYVKTCEKNQENGKRGGRPKAKKLEEKSPEETDRFLKKPKKAKAKARI